MTDMQRQLLEALRARGYDAVTGKGGYHVRGVGFRSTARVRQMVSMPAAKRVARERVGPWGEWAWIAGLHRKLSTAKKKNPARHGTARDIPARWTPATVKRLPGGGLQIRIGGRR